MDLLKYHSTDAYFPSFEIVKDQQSTFKGEGGVHFPGNSVNFQGTQVKSVQGQHEDTCLPGSRLGP